MKKQVLPITLLSLLTASANLHAASPAAGFTAYHTRTNPSPVGHIGRYEDLIVVLGKTNRLEHSHSRIIANTPARVVIHWRYPCVDVNYKNINAKAWTDEYHTIHPDDREPPGARSTICHGLLRPGHWQTL